MEWVETTGRTVEEAKDAALDKLGVAEDDADFEILEEPKVGLFGRLRSEARVRARVQPSRPRPKDERRNRRRKGNGKAGEPATDAAPPPSASAAPPSPPPSRPAAAPRRAAAADPNPPTTPAQGATMDQDVPLSEQAEVARTFLTGLLGAFDAPADVQVREVDEDTMELAVTGSDLGLLIGPSGATLTAIQEVTRTVVQRQTGGRNGRLLVDVAGYRQKRRAALERFVHTVADEVRSTGVAKALEPMHAADRKVVHDTVNDLEGVTTSSQGEEPRRWVVISPA